MTKEQKFYDALQDVFVGVEVEGQGGFINLMRIKSNYYKRIEGLLKEDVEKALDEYPSFRDELFDKLYSFFYRYFTQNGSIYFNDTAFHNNVYERVYTNEKDVVLFWKTQMLYYVKTDTIYRSMPIEFDGFRFNFDASHLRNGQANEKKELIFSLREVKDEEMIFDIAYSENGTKTQESDILRKLKDEGVFIKEEELIKAFKVFKRQAEMDFFINKNAKTFLREQFKLWSYQYFWEGAEEWDADRVNQLQILKTIAFKVIDFISQFEDELVKIWNKPKFVKNSNYVISLDRLSDELVNKIKQAKGYKEQLKEWEALGIDPNNPKAPIDTKYFKDLELSILAQFDNLDEALDGWLIKSENYQALNTILPKFKDKVQCIYIDPPFNTGGDFSYVDKFRASSWLSLIEDRILLGKEFLANTGNYFLHLDENANYLGKILCTRHFHPSYIKEIVFDTNATKDEEADLFAYKSFGNSFVLKKQTIFHIAQEGSKFNKLFKPNRRTTQLNIGQMDLIGKLKTDNSSRSDYIYQIEKWVNGEFSSHTINISDEEKIYPLGDIWNDIYSFTQSEMRVAESLAFTASQKPENLIRRILQSTTDVGDLVLDFFAGIGTTAAVAQKIGRKWLLVEMGDHFHNFYKDDNTVKLGLLGRLKNILNGDQSFKAVDKDRRPHLSKDVNWQGGGFFKYYELEQYEEALDKCKYEDGDLFIQNNKSDYEQYVFLPDEKMLAALELDYDNNKVNVDLSKLYANIDIAETLSNLTGKWIKAIREDEVEFTDGNSINTKDLDYKEIRSLIWWE